MAHERPASSHILAPLAGGAGEALNWWVFPVLVLLLLMSLCPAKR